MLKMRILLTNDDGYNTKEIQTLKQYLRNAGHHVVLVAPSSNESWGGTTLQASANRVRLRKIDSDEYSLECEDVVFKEDYKPWPASPAQCYIVGEEIFPFDVLISGINIGQNTSQTCLFSGTIGAVYACISNVVGKTVGKAIGISLGLFYNDDRLNFACNFVVDFLKNCFHTVKPGIGLNINIPGGLPNGSQIPIESVSLNISGKSYNIIGLGEDFYHVLSSTKDSNTDRIFVLGDDYRPPSGDVKHSDNAALNKGYITIVPIVPYTYITYK